MASDRPQLVKAKQRQEATDVPPHRKPLGLLTGHNVTWAAILLAISALCPAVVAFGDEQPRTGTITKVDNKKKQLIVRSGEQWTVYWDAGTTFEGPAPAKGATVTFRATVANGKVSATWLKTEPFCTAGMPPLKSDGKPTATYLDDVQLFATTQDLHCRFLIFNVAQAEVAGALKAELATTGGPDRNSIATYRDILSHLKALVSDADPTALKLDFYAATQYSNLYRDPAKSSSYFSSNRTLGFLEAHQVVLQLKSPNYAGFRMAIEAYTNLSTQTATGVSSDKAQDVLAGTTGFGAEMGLVYWGMNLSTVPVDLGGVVGGGVVGFPSDLNTKNSGNPDVFHGTFKSGVILKERYGQWRGSLVELDYLHDPRFVHYNRFGARLRVLLAPETASGTAAGLGAFVEGAVNYARAGVDEVRVTAGIQVDAMAILRAIAGLPGSGAPGGTAAPASKE